MRPGIILGHEGVGVAGAELRQRRPRLIPSTIACGVCSY